MCFNLPSKLANFNVLHSSVSRYFLSAAFVLSILSSWSLRVEEAYKALGMYDYFKAKALFYQDQKKKSNAAASYGLALIYSRTDNPFSNADSAAKYVSLSYNAFQSLRRPQSFPGFKIDTVSIKNLCDSIAYKAYQKVRKNADVIAIDRFLRLHYLASKTLLKKAIELRDEMEFDLVIKKNSSDSTLRFIITHPQSAVLQEALLLRDRQLFDEQTVNGTSEDYVNFIAGNPGNAMINGALEKLYNIYRERSDMEGLKTFVRDYPNAPQINEAWKLLFSLRVKSFSNSDLEKFLSEFPSFPFKNSILKELTLNNIRLYPYQREDFFGYIDTLGKISIQPVYDAVSDFSEGLAVVSRNDSVFYINKENENSFAQYFADAYPFRNGLAPVKKNNKWIFINRQGQATGQFYDEVAELSNEVYVVKRDGKYGAVDHFGQMFMEPRFDKLGDFKNGYAYYIENGKYGFVSKNGFVQKAEFEWISDFDEKNFAIVKQNGLYGIINSQGAKVLDPAYDLVLKAPKNIFIVVKNSLYGFFSGEGCYLTQVNYDFMKEKPAEFYTNGNILKLLRKNEQALMDKNGRLSVDFGTFDEIGFASDGLIRVKKKSKYGFTDRKLSLFIPAKFDKAGDFSDGLAIVTLKDKNMLINTAGKEIFETAGSMEKISAHYYLVEEEQKNALNNKGEKVFTNIKSTQKIATGILAVTLNNNEIRLLKD
jgi:hypothetical protein